MEEVERIVEDISFRYTTDLKVLKCEIFDHCVFRYFYTIKPLLVGDFGDEITDGFNTCHFILVSSCAVYADNNF
jgi:hypothetical protein